MQLEADAMALRLLHGAQLSRQLVQRLLGVLAVPNEHAQEQEWNRERAEEELNLEDAGSGRVARERTATRERSGHSQRADDGQGAASPERTEAQGAPEHERHGQEQQKRRIP